MYWVAITDVGTRMRGVAHGTASFEPFYVLASPVAKLLYRLLILVARFNIPNDIYYFMPVYDPNFSSN